jgi:site-specific DNA-methyltransferase (adenine-specific)
MQDWIIIPGDCREVMSVLEPGSVRLIFADPPYNQGIDYGAHHNDKMSREEYLAFSESWIRVAVPLLTSDGSLWLLISHEWTWELIPRAIAAGLHYHPRPVTWYETFGKNCPRDFNRCSRLVLRFHASPKRFVFNENCPEIRRPSDRQTKYQDKRANPNGKTWDDVWKIPRLAGTHRERLDVPTQLPLRLLRPIVGCASDPGDLILDPFAGSGTSGVVALEMHRRYVGIEKSERFAMLASRRLENVTPPLPALIP